MTSDGIEDVELRQFAEQTKEKMSLKETEREKNAVFNQECIKKLGLTGRFILTGDLGRIVSQRANEYMTTEDYLAAIEASKSPLVKSLTYKRTDFEELEPELFPELTKPSDMYETTAVVSSVFFGQTMNSDENTYLTDEELVALKKFAKSRGKTLIGFIKKWRLFSALMGIFITGSIWKTPFLMSLHIFMARIYWIFL